jgi:hypothetical protein
MLAEMKVSVKQRAMLDELYQAWPLSQERILAVQTRLDDYIRNEKRNDKRGPNYIASVSMGDQERKKDEVIQT